MATLNVGVIPIVEKIVKNRFRWFAQVKKRPVDSVVSRVHQLERSETTKGRGKLKKL